MTINELKQLQLYRQHLTNKSDKLTVVRDLCGVQSQYLSNAYHSLFIRCADRFDLKDNWSDGLTKNWTVRGTVHVFDKADLPLFKYDDGMYLSNEWNDAICNGDLWISAERKKLFADFIVERVNSRGSITREELRDECRAFGMTKWDESYIFDGWGGLLRPLCERGFISYRAQEKKAFEAVPRYEPMRRETALKEQFTRYLNHMAPASMRDIAYFFGFSQAKVKEVLGCLDVKTLTISGSEYFCMGMIPDDLPDIPGCLFLAGFDQLMLGYQKQDSIYISREHIRGIFSLAGIVFPCVLLDGNAVGRWKKKNKKIVVSSFDELRVSQKKIIEDAAEELWRGEIKSIEFDLI